ncbi:hypothetical protein SUDANB120_03398 [Streptomyces sp. enrichment culture]
MSRVDGVNEQHSAPAAAAGSGRTADTGRRFGSLRTLAGELFTFERNPLPGMSRPRWLARLPHLLLGYVVVLCTFLTTEQMSSQYRVSGNYPLVAAVVSGAAVVLAMFRPIAGWWMALAGASMVAVQTHGHAGKGQGWPWTLAGVVLFAFVVLLVALRVPPRVTTAVVGLSVAFGALAELRFRPAGSESTIPATLLLFTFAGVLGYALRAGRLARRKLVEQETLTEEERARRALLEERSRIARELHDVVAHHMSVISIQAQVAPHLVKDPPPELRENLAGIRENALEALTELRRVLGVLRSEQAADPANPHHPQPTLAELEGLVGNVRSAGLEVTTAIAGIRRPLAPGVELTAYRIVQEALSNCLRHAPGSQVEVGIAYGPRELHLCVANTAPTRKAPPSHGAGHGLLGMRERAGMLGGELAAGPRPGGGYEVSAVLPVDPLTN